MQNPEAGWTIGDGTEHPNPDQQDHEDSLSLYEILENEIAPLYYDRGGAASRMAGSNI